MIILGGEPPFIDTPEPDFGDVLVKFNELSLNVQAKTVGFSENTKASLADLNAALNTFVNTSLAAINAHINARGALHGETKATINLAKKDNFPTATIDQQRNLADVNAFVTPAGIKAAVDQVVGDLNQDNYQQNDKIWMASYFNPDVYPSVIPTRVESPRYLGREVKVGMLFNADKIILSPVSDFGKYDTQLIFTTLPTITRAMGGVAEVNNLGNAYYSGGWNSVGGMMDDGRVGLFKAIADKHLYTLKDSIGLTNQHPSFLLYNSSASMAYKGVVASYQTSGSTISLHLDFLSVNFGAVDPEIIRLVDDTYLLTRSDLSGGTTDFPANAGYTINLASYLSLPQGATLTVDDTDPTYRPVISLFWHDQDKEFYVHAAVPVIVTNNGITRYWIVRFTDSVIPGALQAGGHGFINPVGDRTPDVIDQYLNFPQAPKFLQENNRLNFLCPIRSPGVVLGSGDVIKAASSKYGIRLKRFRTDYKGAEEFLTAIRPMAAMGAVTTERYAPSQYAPFGSLSERIIPIARGANSFQYLSYCINPRTGQYEWRELNWNKNTIIGTDTGDKRFGITLPATVYTRDQASAIPDGMSVTGFTGNINSTALVFTKTTNYIGRDSVIYSNGNVTLGKEITLDKQSLLALQAMFPAVRARAAILNPGTVDGLRVMNVQIYTIYGRFDNSGTMKQKALILFTDGLCYAEAALTDFTLNSITKIYTPNLNPTGGFNLHPVTLTATGPTTGHRQSTTGDGIPLMYTDLYAHQPDYNTLNIAISRPFEDVYGDLSFTISGFYNTPGNLSFVPVGVNPARLWQNTEYFDTVVEQPPIIPITDRGVFQPATLYSDFANDYMEVNGLHVVNPNYPNEAGWVRIPGGSRVILKGRTYILTQSFDLKVPTTGTAYCYFVVNNGVFTTMVSTTKRPISTAEICFGTVTNGIFTQEKSYIVLNDKVISPTRQGSAIPVLEDDGLNGINQFFYGTDVS